ncbi:MAG: tyrosine-type recombinase/integrase [Candidatus Babeliaceae bacterium]|nr:tyrosine-type recombinase/integrase [Candidatus Babeliaceae bacterium]
METNIQTKRLYLRTDPEEIPALLALPKAIQALPDWFREPLEDFLRLRQRNWPAKTVRRSTSLLCGRLVKIGLFLIQTYSWTNWGELSVRWIDDYIDKRLRDGIAPRTINFEISFLKQFCFFLEDSGYSIPQSIFNIKQLTTPQNLPRPLPGNDVFLLEKHILDARIGDKRWERDKKAFRGLAWFYLMWHCGLRVSEVSNLQLSDVDYEKNKLLIEDSKERKDRVVYMSDTTAKAIQNYLKIFASSLSVYLFEHQGRPITTRMIQDTLTRYGNECGIEVSPHRLRHTFATQMLNAGMPITSLQRYLGHENIDTTMIYAKVSDVLLQYHYEQALQGLDEEWHPDDHIRKVRFACQDLRKITGALDELKENADGFYAALNELQKLLQQLEEDMS